MCEVGRLNNGISRVRLNDPDTYNSMSFNMLNSLIAALKDLDKDKKTRVIIIEGSGKGFSAGHNLKEVRSLKGKPNYKKLFDQNDTSESPRILKIFSSDIRAGQYLKDKTSNFLSKLQRMFSSSREIVVLRKYIILYLDYENIFLFPFIM